MMPSIRKADGTLQPFDPERLEHSLRRAGAAEHAARRIALEVTTTVHEGASSKDVYRRAFTLMRKEARPVAARYALRRALLELGPTGHPFEDFVSRLFVKEGWKVETRKMIRGKCVVHETDFYASHPARGEYLAAELKYHNDPGYKTDLKVALYVKSRFDDIFACDEASRACPIDRGLLVTNTKFTTEAIQYAECAGVELLGWSYPVGASLLDQMQRARVYPVTALTSLSGSAKRILIEQHVLTVDEIAENASVLDPLRLSPEKVGNVRAEVAGMLELPHVPSA